MRTTIKALAGVAVLSLALSSVGAAQLLPGFNGTTFPGNDDGSTGLLSPGFSLNFFGTTYTSFYLNNNGNITFGGALSTYTPFAIVTTGDAMIAPFFADVDTRAGNPVTYGTGTVGGQNAWGADWYGVCFFGSNCANTNTFQLVLVDRSDVAAGDFDFYYNYTHIGWETGQASGSDAFGRGGSCARVGWTNGVSTSLELPGSAVCGAFLDGGPDALISNSNVGVNGRYEWNVRNGQVIANVTPEPFSIILLGTGLAGIGAVRRLRNRNKKVA